MREGGRRRRRKSKSNRKSKRKRDRDREVKREGGVSIPTSAVHTRRTTKVKRMTKEKRKARGTAEDAV